MKKLALLILPVVFLVACQTGQEPAKTEPKPSASEIRPAEEKKETKLIVNDEKPLPAKGNTPIRQAELVSPTFG